MRVALTLGVAAGFSALVGVCSSVGACGSTPSCCGSCLGSEPAVINLSCAPTGLTSVTVTGPCDSPFDFDARSEYTAKALYVSGEKAGTCHVVLTFATGYTSAVDVTFSAETSFVCGSPSCGSCGTITRPTTGPFTVNNPPDTCVVTPDAGGG